MGVIQGFNDHSTDTPTLITTGANEILTRARPPMAGAPILLTMATYVSLIRFTEKGASQIRSSADRGEAFDAAASAAGVTIVAQYWTLGSYDGVLIVQADTEAKALHWLTELVSAGNVRTETMQGFTAEEFRAILQSSPGSA